MAARHEDEAFGFGYQSVVTEPAPEVIGIIGIGAHARGGDVQHMVELAGRIGDAAAEARALLDQRDADIGGAAQQVRGERHAAGATADDENGEAWMRFVHSRVSPVAWFHDAKRPYG
ncbi:hypothetical protein VW23_000855 [Devosia insulae DS-56]|uniref:Uncharacterized protein n=1 Tax=Devosia insulae DS-56 TaxID=1116389 RepID=A0A1E5XU45_9HYPH|nr:hypothetical protein VW23_000855 [Devosia insulae DS-56]